MLIRAGASNRAMVEALGVNINRLFLYCLRSRAALAGLAGLLIAPITEASIGMGNDIIIVAFVVCIVGGIGSVKGAFYAAMILGLLDTMGLPRYAAGDDDAGHLCGNRSAGDFRHADLHPDGGGTCISSAGFVSPCRIKLMPGRFSISPRARCTACCLLSWRWPLLTGGSPGRFF